MKPTNDELIEELKQLKSKEDGSYTNPISYRYKQLEWWLQGRLDVLEEDIIFLVRLKRLLEDEPLIEFIRILDEQIREIEGKIKEIKEGLEE